MQVMQIFYTSLQYDTTGFLLNINDAFQYSSFILCI